MRSGYKQTSLGEIPEEWEVVELNEIADIKGRVGWRGYKRTDFVEKGHGAISLGANNISKDNKLMLDELTYISLKKYEESPEIKVNKGDIILTQRGSIGGTCLVSMDLGKVTINPNVLLIKNIKINPYFLHKALSSNFIQNQILRLTSSTTIPLLTQQQIKSLKIIVPKSPEQKKIAEVLSTVEDAIQHVDEAITKTERLKQGLMQKLLSEGIGNKEFKDTAIGRIPKIWNIVKLGEYCYIKGRIGWRGLKASEYTSEGPYLIANKHLIDSIVDWAKCDHLSEYRYEESPEIQLERDDVIMSKDGTIGQLAFIDYLPGKATINSTMMLLRSNRSELNSKYLFYFLQGRHFKLFLYQKNSGSSIPHIFQRDMQNLDVSLPSVNEQRKIAEILSTIDHKLELESERKGRLVRIKKGLMNDLLTGRKRLGVS